jgi:hypothetical protein
VHHSMCDGMEYLVASRYLLIYIADIEQRIIFLAGTYDTQLLSSKTLSHMVELAEADR